jgi:hypothetical protein
MNSLVLRRVLAAVGVLLAIGYGCLDTWVGSEFHRGYFPGAPMTLGISSVAACVVFLGYFVSVFWTGQGAPWRRHR